MASEEVHLNRLYLSPKRLAKGKMRLMKVDAYLVNVAGHNNLRVEEIEEGVTTIFSGRDF